MRPFVRLGVGWASSVGPRQIVSWRRRFASAAGEASFGAANVRSRKHHDLVSIPGNKMGILQRVNLVRHFCAWSVIRLALDSISALLKPMTSTGFWPDLPASVSQ